MDIKKVLEDSFNKIESVNKHISIQSVDKYESMYDEYADAFYLVRDTAEGMRMTVGCVDRERHTYLLDYVMGGIQISSVIFAGEIIEGYYNKNEPTKKLSAVITHILLQSIRGVSNIDVFSAVSESYSQYKAMQSLDDAIAEILGVLSSENRNAQNGIDEDTFLTTNNLMLESLCEDVILTIAALDYVENHIIPNA